MTAISYDMFALLFFFVPTGQILSGFSIISDCSVPVAGCRGSNTSRIRGASDCQHQIAFVHIFLLLQNFFCLVHSFRVLFILKKVIPYLQFCTLQQQQLLFSWIFWLLECLENAWHNCFLISIHLHVNIVF
jgi:hypothetical protein